MRFRSTRAARYSLRLPEYFNLSTGIIVSAGVFMVIGGLWAVAALSNIVNVAVIYVGILFGGIAMR